MADKYLKIDTSTGNPTEVEATVTSAGAGDAGEIVALNATGKLDNSLMPTGVGAETQIMTTSEDLTAGDFVNVYDVTGTTTARKADASTIGKEANGFVLASSTSGNNATVYVNGINDQLTGLTGGTMMFLSASSAGDATATPPSSTGNIIQKVGKAISTTAIAFEPGETYVLA